jgi:hypothetical protein
MLVYAKLYRLNIFQMYVWFVLHQLISCFCPLYIQADKFTEALTVHSEQHIQYGQVSS